MAKSNSTNATLPVCLLLLEPSINGPTSALLFKEVMTPLILLFGVLGNCLSFAVMSSRVLRLKSYSQYLCALAIFDTFNLIDREIRVVEELMDSMGRPGPFHGVSDGTCKLYRFIQSVSVSMSSWLVVLMAVERFVVIFFPFRRHVICTSSRSVLAILFVFFLICSTQIYTLVMMGYNNIEEGCSALPRYNMPYLELYTYFYLLCIILIFPMATIIVCNVAVALKISHYRRAREKFRSSEKNVLSISRQRLKTTAMLLTITSVYVVTLLPSVMSLFIIQATIVEAMSNSVMDEAMCRKLLNFQPYGHVLEVISAINYGVNFYIYVLSGKAFRVELKKILKRESSSSSRPTRICQ